MFGLTTAGWLIAAVVSGFALPPLLTQIFAWTEHVAPSERLTEANAWIVSAMTVGIAVGTLGAGAIVGALPGGSGLVAAVAAGSIAALLAALLATPSSLRSTGESLVLK